MNILPNFSLLSQAARVSRRSFPDVVWEALKLRLFHCRLDLSEYLAFRLYLKDIAFSEKTAFCGHRMQSILIETLVDEYSKFSALDKITGYFLLRAGSFPTPDIYAVYRSRRPRALLNLSTPEELETYLSKPENLPVYIKRSSGTYGNGNTLVNYLDDNKLHFGTGPSHPIRDFCHSLDSGGTLGWILQQPLTAHANIAGISGTDKISSLRLHTFSLSTGPQIIGAILRVNAGHLDYDNFRHGASGNLLAAVDIKTGKIIRIVSGLGWQQIENPLHPKTNRNLLGFEIPYWNDIVELVLEAHLLFPGYLCPGWDIAICDTGPTILEINYFGDADVPQQAYRLGFLNPEFMNLLRAQGIDKVLRLDRKQRQKIFSSPDSAIKGHVGTRRHHWQW